MKNFLAPPMTQAYFQFKAGDQMRYYKRMRVVTQSGFPSVIITPYCAVCERSNQVLVVGGGGCAVQCWGPSSFLPAHVQTRGALSCW